MEYVWNAKDKKGKVHILRERMVHPIVNPAIPGTCETVYIFAPGHKYAVFTFSNTDPLYRQEVAIPRNFADDYIVSIWKPLDREFCQVCQKAHLESLR